jgi:hypothetical protein
VHRERTAGDAVALDSLGEEVLGELGALPLGEQPANGWISRLGIKPPLLRQSSA